ncbi:MAG TPA: hypothetical protein VFI96_08285 [Longimicrobiaceae bacterium]|nr:hypothetical protein [Longimicrobiaceae bacterium]
MDHPDSIILQLGSEIAAPVLIRKRTAERSPHTGRELVQLHGWITTDDAAQHSTLNDILAGVDDRSVTATDGAGEFAGKWCVSWNSYAESGGVHTYTVLLREAEDLSLDALLLGGLELHPYEYREAVVEGGLTISAKVLGSEADVRTLRALFTGQESFPVVRRGIQDEPREMRLGVAEWSPFEDGVKYRLVMVDAGLNEEMRLELARIEEENTRAALGYYENFVERHLDEEGERALAHLGRENSRAAQGFYMNFAEQLVQLLIGKGLLTREEVEAARDAAIARPVVAHRDFWHVPDIDSL